MCVDYRALSKGTIRNNYLLPRNDEVWDQIGDSRYFSSLDLRSGYNQIRIAEKDTYKTCIRTKYDAYEVLVVPAGLAGVPPVFQSLMNRGVMVCISHDCCKFLIFCKKMVATFCTSVTLAFNYFQRGKQFYPEVQTQNKSSRS
jgi:hypothetical protein